MFLGRCFGLLSRPWRLLAEVERAQVRLQDALHIRPGVSRATWDLFLSPIA